MPTRMTELPRPHDLRTNPPIKLLSEHIINTTPTTRLRHPTPPPGPKHPLMQPIPRMTEMQLTTLTLTGAETVERDGEVLNPGE